MPKTLFSLWDGGAFGTASCAKAALTSDPIIQSVAMRQKPILLLYRFPFPEPFDDAGLAVNAIAACRAQGEVSCPFQHLPPKRQVPDRRPLGHSRNHWAVLRHLSVLASFRKVDLLFTTDCSLMDIRR